MSDPALIYDPNAGDLVPANLDFAADGLYVFNRQGRRLQHWPYAEIVNAYPDDSNRIPFIAYVHRREVALQLQDGAVYDAIRERAPQLKRWRRGGRIVLQILRSLPDEAHLEIWIAVALAGFTLYSWVSGLFD